MLHTCSKLHIISKLGIVLHMIRWELCMRASSTEVIPGEHTHQRGTDSILAVPAILFAPKE